MLRVVVDANLWISFLIGRKLAVLKELFVRGDLQLLSSYEQLAKLGDVASRLKFRKYSTDAQAEDLLNLLCAFSELVDVTEYIHACREEDDDYLLEIAVNGRAYILITGDADLLVLHPFRGGEILSHSDFEHLVSKGQDSLSSS